MANRLAKEKSPYLLQHADNPVDWYPWGLEAFQKAAKENRPIFLSIGYSTCHWCHVMAHESFQDSQVANLMNNTFISIKVDREERPDIDMLYMSVCQMMTGSGGWPLTIIMTPVKKPFFAGTYIPRETRFGRQGMLELIPSIKEIWETRKGEVMDSAGQITAALQNAALQEPGEKLDEAILHLAYEQLKDRFDEKSGGFGRAPKFPTPHNVLFLLRHWKRTNNGEALAMVEKTLQAMRCGGIYDQIGFGFHRYSTDRHWLVPHFEKMLYDQALLAMAYLETFQATGNEEYAGTAREIFTYVLRDMTAGDGGFYSAEDADSEGREGKFYLWTYDEMKQMLTPKETEFAFKVYNVQENGNFSEETAANNEEENILHLTKSISESASEFYMTVPEFRKRLESVRQKLFVYRNKRIHPAKDRKILTDWNGLMIAALAMGARVLDEQSYADAANRAVGFIFSSVRYSKGQFRHRYCDGLKLNEYMLKHFWDDKNGGFFFTSDDAESLLVRQKEIYDGAIPSGNSIAMLNLLRLGRMTANSELEQKASEIGRAFFNKVGNSPAEYTQLMIAVDFSVGPSYEVVIAGDFQGEDTKKMLNVIGSKFIPNKIAIFLPSGTDLSEIMSIAPFTRDQPTIDNRATAYVCVNYNCKLPTTDINNMISLLNSR